MRMYTMTEAAELAGVNWKTVDRMIKRNEVQAEKSGGVYRISECDIEKLKKHRRKLKYYKVSVYSEELCGYVVKKCSLRKGEAMKLAADLKAAGFAARFSEH